MRLVRRQKFLNVGQSPIDAAGNSDRGALVFGSSLRCFAVDEEVAGWLGAEGADFLLWNWRQFVQADDRDDVCRMANRLQTGRLPLARHVKLRTLKGSTISVHLRWLWRTNQRGEPGLLIAMLRRETAARPDQRPVL